MNTSRSKHRKRNKPAVSSGLHKATFLALIISNVTAFLLAALFSHVLLGGGLAYFAAMREQTRINISYATTAALITDPTLVFSVPQVTKPGYLAPINDLTFGTRITLIADHTSTTIAWAGPPAGSGIWGSDARQHYSKDQPWNSDNTLIALQNIGSPSVVYLDGETYQPKYGKCSSYSIGDDRWHPSSLHPHERINAKGSELMWYDVTTCTKTRTWVLQPKVNGVPTTISVKGIGDGEGNVSNDGRYVLLSNTDGTAMFVVEMDPFPGRIGPAIDVSNCGLITGCAIDWVSISPSGKYAVVSYAERPNDSTSNGDHPRVYDVNLETLGLSPRQMVDNPQECSGHDPLQGYIFDVGHADMTMNLNEDVIVGQRRSWCDSSVTTDDSGRPIGGVMMVRLSDGWITSLTNPVNEAYPHHISARNLDRSGWVYVGYYQGSGRRFNDEIVAIKLDGSAASNTIGSVERLAHKHSVFSGCYRCESHAVPSRDGMRVIFASNWLDNSGPLCGVADIKAYVVDTRALRSGGDVVPPTISAMTTANISTTNATLDWNTSEASDSQVDYGATTCYGQSTTLSASLVTSHMISLNGLAVDTPYHYRVRSRDAAGNLTLSSDATFSTLPASGSRRRQIQYTQ